MLVKTRSSRSFPMPPLLRVPDSAAYSSPLVLGVRSFFSRLRRVASRSSSPQRFLVDVGGGPWLSCGGVRAPSSENELERRVWGGSSLPVRPCLLGSVRSAHHHRSAHAPGSRGARTGRADGARGRGGGVQGTVGRTGPRSSERVAAYRCRSQDNACVLLECWKGMRGVSRSGIARRP